MRENVGILNIQINNMTLNELLEKLKIGVVLTPNVDHLMLIQKDKEFYDLYKKAEFVVCDSQILYLASKLTKTSLIEKISGSDLLPGFCEFHKNNDEIKVFLLGAKKGIAKKACENINNKMEREIVVGYYSPTLGFESNENECKSIIELINSTKANVLAVGVGSPKQEKWIYKYKNQLKNINIFMGIGATIDFESGTIKRAPKIITNLGFEWLYRLMKEPRRLWKRYLVRDIKFVVLFLKQLLKLYKNPWEIK